MKKTELYRSIDGIKQDESLKEHILKAAEENDVVTVVKRPVFIPVIIVLLLCLNVGMVAKLVIFNKSQVNMSEFKAKTNISSAADTSDESLSKEESDLKEALKDKSEAEKEELRRQQAEKEEAQKQSEAEAEMSRLDEAEKEAQKSSEAAAEAEKAKEQQEQEKMEQQLFEYQKQQKAEQFEDAKAAFFAELETNSYEIVEEYSMSEPNIWVNESFFCEWGAYYTRSTPNHQDSNNYFYRRYVQYAVCGDTKVYSNHEYSVGYKDGFENENIISIMETNVKSGSMDMAFIEGELKKIKQESSQQNIRLKAEETANSYSAKGISNIRYTPELVFYVFPPKDEIEKKVIFRYSLTFDYESNWEGKSGSETCQLYFDSSGDTPDFNWCNTESPWKELYFSKEQMNDSNMVMIPDIIGMDFDEAKTVLEKAGIKYSRNYQSAYAIYGHSSFNYGEVMDIGSFKAGQMITRDTIVQVSVCGKMIPYQDADSIDEYTEKLRNIGFDVTVEYEEDVQPDDPGLYVSRTKPGFGEAYPKDNKVTVYISSTDIDCTVNILGKAVDLKRHKIYTAEKTQELISSAEPSEEMYIDLTEYGYKEYEETVFYGKKYGDVFVPDSFHTTGSYSMALPFIICGWEESSIQESQNNEFYKGAKLQDASDVMVNTGTELDGFRMQPNYWIQYYKKRQGTINAYIRTENGIVKEVYVSAGNFLDFDK